MRVIRHFLGSGCSLLLSLTHKNQHDNVRCSCYDPLCGLFSYEVETYCSSFVTSFVLDIYLAARLSVENMEYLRNDSLSIFTFV